MAKRFTDTEIWKRQYWFKKLDPLDKLAFIYIKDSCDHAGLWKIDMMSLIEDTGLSKFVLTDFVKKVNVEYDPMTGEKGLKNRIETLDKGYLWITGFVQFQYENKGKTVSPKPAAIASALKVLEGFELLNKALERGYITLNEPLQRVKDKDRDKDKEEIRRSASKKEIVHVDDVNEMFPLEEAQEEMLRAEMWQTDIMRHLKQQFGHVLSFTEMHTWIGRFVEERKLEGVSGLRSSPQAYKTWFKNWVKVELKSIKAGRGNYAQPEVRLPYRKKLKQ